MQLNTRWIPMAVAGLALSGCFETEIKIHQPGAGNADNQAPAISGEPPEAILEGQLYEFTPTASDPDGDVLEFSVSRKPGWASFDKATGRLRGTPDAGDVGTFAGIEIAVSDGTASAVLTAFDISVNTIAAGSATLSWMPPTSNNDGTTLVDLAGYRIYYGRDLNNLTQVVELDNPGLTRYMIENLTPDRWYFAMTSVNDDGVESPRTDAVSKTIS